MTSESVIACLIDALMVIVVERNNSHITLGVNSCSRSDWIDLHSIITSGEATKSQLQEVSNAYFSITNTVLYSLSLILRLGKKMRMLFGTQLRK